MIQLAGMNDQPTVCQSKPSWQQPIYGWYPSSVSADTLSVLHPFFSQGPRLPVGAYVPPLQVDRLGFCLHQIVANEATLPDMLDIADMYERLSHHHTTSIILGDPGSGKTTLLLALCRHAIVRDRPVLFISADHLPTETADGDDYLHQHYALSSLPDTALCLIDHASTLTPSWQDWLQKRADTVVYAGPPVNFDASLSHFRLAPLSHLLCHDSLSQWFSDDLYAFMDQDEHFHFFHDYAGIQLKKYPRLLAQPFYLHAFLSQLVNGGLQNRSGLNQTTLLAAYQEMINQIAPTQVPSQLYEDYRSICMACTAFKQQPDKPLPNHCLSPVLIGLVVEQMDEPLITKIATTLLDRLTYSLTEDVFVTLATIQALIRACPHRLPIRQSLSKTFSLVFSLTYQGRVSAYDYIDVFSASHQRDLREAYHEETTSLKHCESLKWIRQRSAETQLFAFFESESLPTALYAAHALTYRFEAPDLERIEIYLQTSDLLQYLALFIQSHLNTPSLLASTLSPFLNSSSTPVRKYVAYLLRYGQKKLSGPMLIAACHDTDDAVLDMAISSLYYQAGTAGIHAIHQIVQYYMVLVDSPSTHQHLEPLLNRLFSIFGPIAFTSITNVITRSSAMHHRLLNALDTKLARNSTCNSFKRRLA